MNSYVKASPYEVFICRAHNCDRGMRNGADLSFMRNLIDTEEGKGFDFLPSYEKQMAAIKKYINKAIDKFLKKKLNNEEKDILHQLKVQVGQANSSAILCEVVDQALQVTDRFK